jgi:alanine racemase
VTIRLSVDRERWWHHVTDVAASVDGLVPVIKGNGYGFGRAALAELAGRLVASLPDHDLPPTLAIGTVHELADVADRVGDAALLVLTPVAPGQSSLLHGRPAIATVASLADITALDGWRGPVLVKLASSMRRFGATPEELHAVVDRASGAGLGVIGASIHLPLAGSDADGIAEIEAWLPVVESHLGAARQLWVSHLGPDAHAALSERHPAWSFPMRVGTRLWHGDKSALHLTTDVLLTRPIAAGEVAGYHATAAPTDGTIVVVGAGTAHGVTPLPDGRSPFHFARRRLTLLEPPHMHSATLFVPTGDDVPSIGQAVDVQRPLISIAPDEVLWT